jgi:hypothetical protein
LYQRRNSGDATTVTTAKTPPTTISRSAFHLA